MTFIDQLVELARERLSLKASEAKAIAARRSHDARIIDLFKTNSLLKEEGTVSEKVAGVVKVAVKTEIKREVKDDDIDKLKVLWPKLSAAQMACFRWKPEVDVANFKALQQANPAEFGMIAHLITSKDGSPSVVVENLQEPNQP